MKKYIILFILITSISCKSQTTYSLSNYDTSVLKDNNYIKDLDGLLDKFVGTWKWIDSTNPNTYLIVQFEKVEHWNASNTRVFYKDLILGNYKYVVNGVEITNTLNYNSNDIHSNNHPVIISSIGKSPFKNLSISMRDVLISKTCNASFEILNLTETPLSAHWKMTNKEHFDHGGNPQPSEFSIPSDVILIKQP
jgi:hypothetical protein